MLTTAAQRAGFGGGVVVDYPNSAKRRKMYLCLMVGQSDVPKGLGENGMEVEGGEEGEEGDRVKNEKRRRRERLKGKKVMKGAVDKEWILKKKELYRTRGKEGVPRDSKVGTRTFGLAGEGFTDSPRVRAVHGEEAKAKVLASRGEDIQSRMGVYQYASFRSCCRKYMYIMAAGRLGGSCRSPVVGRVPSGRYTPCVPRNQITRWPGRSGE